MSKKDKKLTKPLAEAVPHVPERKKRHKVDRSPVPPPADLPTPISTRLPAHLFPPNAAELMTAPRLPRSEPAWAAKVREVHDAGPVGPPPLDIPEGRYNLDAPFVELCLRHTGAYIGPTRGRVIGEDENGFDFLTHTGLYFVGWTNLAYWIYLSEG